jgi:FkbM family methyltransferase
MFIKTESIERKIKSLIPLKLKNLIINFFVNNFTGFIIKKLKIKFNLFNGIFNYNLVSNYEAASIFFGIYESAEIRFSKRFAKSKIIIELGSSVGVMLGTLANNRDNTKFICVEASKRNYLKFLKLKKFIPKKKNQYISLNRALYYSGPNVNFEENTTVTSKITKNNLKTNKSYKVLGVTLSGIIKKYCVKERFTLISDVEGAEASIFFKDINSLKLCETIIAELSNTFLYTVKDQVLKIKKIGFKLVECYGNVYVFSR